MSQENVDLVRGGYDDFNSGNIEGVTARFHPEIEWVEPGGGNRVEVEGARDEGDTVVVTSHFRGKSKSGAEFDLPGEQTWEIHDGKLAHFENKVDSEAWAKAWS
jgi:ketosteroid isomerase-like protein